MSGVDAASTRSVVVEGGGIRGVGSVGLHALGSFADRLGIPATLSMGVGRGGPVIPTCGRGGVLSG
jgi:hypothetical protein